MSGTKPDQFHIWSTRLNDSDEEAFTELFDHTYDRLRGYVRQFIFDADAAADVLQDVYVKIWNMRGSIDPEKSLRALMYQMVRNQALNHIRNQKDKNVSLDSVSPEVHMEQPDIPEIGETDSAKKLHARMNEWIQELPERQREAFELSRFEGMSHHEIASVMDLRPRTVNNHIVLALNTLREKLDRYRSENPNEL